MTKAPEPSPEIQVDLHRCTREEALRKLAREIHGCRVRRIELLLVITGAGHGSRSKKPVLRDAVEDFLRSPRGRELGVRSFERVHRGGALVVRLAVS